MSESERDVRQDIIENCLFMNKTGLNQGTSGNISARHAGHMLITPSATPYEKMTPEMIARMPLDGGVTGRWEGPLNPSVEWRMHEKLLESRPDIGAVVHAHPTYCTTLAILGMDIPACHYMIAAFGGNDVRCSGYATYGSPELSDMAVEAMKGRTACLLANHGMIAMGSTLQKAMWTAVELETLARQYYLSLQIGTPNILTGAQLDDVRKSLGRYGLQDDYMKIGESG
jgi:L-fuculose-phosphate aldolase